MDRPLERYAQLAALIVLVGGCLLVLQPFLTPILFAAVICSSTWPVFRRLADALGGRRSLAAGLMCLALVVLVVGPVAMLAMSLADALVPLVDAGRKWIEAGPPQPPRWLAALPLVGEWLDAYWHQVAESREELAALARRATPALRDFAVALGGGLGRGLVQVSFAVFIAFFFYRDGAALMQSVRAGLQSVIGGIGPRVIDTVRGTIDGVVFGLLGTAIAQGVVAAIGFLIAGVPGAALLGAGTFLLSLVPLIGPPFIWGAVAIWLYAEGQIGWAIFMVAYGTFAISGVDNVVKPLLISRGASLPFVLVVLGVFGGLLAFGFIGVFVGPTLLAVGYNLGRIWTQVRAERVAATVAPPP